MHTLEPREVGMNYTTLVTHPDGYAPDPGHFDRAASGGTDVFLLHYKKDDNAKAGTDLWDTGIEFKDNRPHPVTVMVQNGAGSPIKETVEVADGTGGGPMGRRAKRITVKYIASFQRWVDRG